MLVLSDSGDRRPGVSRLACVSRFGDAGPDIELRGAVSWLLLLLRGNSPNGKPSQLVPVPVPVSVVSPRGVTGELELVSPFKATATAAALTSGGVPATAAVVPPEGTASSICLGGCGVSSMTDRTLRSFDSALRELLPGGDDGWLRRLGDWALVGGVVRSAAAEAEAEEDDDDDGGGGGGTTSAQSDAASSSE